MVDTDALKLDDAEICSFVSDERFSQSLRKIMKEMEVRSSSFSVGYRFYYWEYYKNIRVLPSEDQRTGFTIMDLLDNTHDHSGFDVNELFVPPKYSDFGEEIRNYSDFPIRQYATAKVKVEKYLQTQKVKAIKARNTEWLHYGIRAGNVVSFWHLLALALYTDHDKLCTKFSESFRALNAFEPLDSVKKRNSAFFWMSKHLRELVECFGQCSQIIKKKKRGYVDQMRGPFHCGLTVVLNLPSLSMRLNSPTSTSKQIEVAMKFSGPMGMVITFDNPRRDEEYSFVRGFDCSWFSCHPEEDERFVYQQCIFLFFLDFLFALCVQSGSSLAASIELKLSI